MSFANELHHRSAASRRDFLCRAGGGFGAIALAGMLAGERQQGHAAGTDPSKPHFWGAARNVIFLFMDGGPSHLDTFDPKPLVNTFAGQPLPPSIKRAITPMGVNENGLLASKRTWKQYGQSGLPVSDWYPFVGECADDLCVIRSCTSDALNHVGGVTQMNTGSILAGRPSLGAWVNYGLGTENRNLPGFVVLLDSDREPPGGNRAWGSGFMPAVHQGTKFLPGRHPILHLNPPAEISDARQRRKLDYINHLNREHLTNRPGDSALEARIASYELAFRMQAHAPEAVDLTQETQATRAAYGLDEPRTQAFGQNCLLARRLVERGVRFVQLYSGSGSKWDAHARIEQNHTEHCGATDRPIAALLNDLKQRGLLEETLVVWGGEFGRTPMSEKGDGRDHNPYGFTMWLAGGGVNGGQIVGATDDFGMHAVERPTHVHSLHATILAALGIHHTELIFPLQGRPERATVNEGEIVTEVFRPS
ncbi:DUF1501 domain-containing protein [Schlesneria paludicola]|uniref:DUF1501 domain-containing protein n=1 Tax=Schlesneria paludicola TaxID=360056 RepID=UPI000299F785|nr:DUF1501 domain-containing protein [Schlesneria paludicola]